MKQLIGLAKIAFLSFFIFLAISSTKAEGLTFQHFVGSKTLINSISGQVFDPYNNPVSDLNVELINDNYSTVARQRISAGRFIFSGISAGSYKVKVLTVGTNYLEQVQDVQIINLLRGASDQQFIDFHLKFDPRKVSLGSGGAPEEIFSQEGISDDARKHFQRGIEQLADKKEKGLIELEQALKISPNYYDALNRLGTEYVQRKEYQKAVPYLIKAIDINQRSFSSFYALGYAAYQMNRIPEAVEAARATTILKPDSINGHWLYGTVLRINGNYEKSEKALLKAKTLSKRNPLSEVNWQLALLYNRLGRYKDAIVELEEYLKAQPNSSNKREIQDFIAQLQTKAK